MSNWEQTHRRYNLVYAVADDIMQSGQAAIVRWQARIEAEFGDTEGFLLDVRRRWNNAMNAFSDEVSPQEVGTVVARHNPALRALLDAFAGHPVLAESRHLRAVRSA